MAEATVRSDATRAENYFISNYPPYFYWRPDELPAFEASLDQSSRPGPLGLYVHLPFCRQRCSYCYFRVHPAPSARDVDGYIEMLLKELSLHASRTAVAGRAPSSAYFGGGTPSYLSLAQIEKLLVGIKARISWKGIEECTFECNPGTVSLEKLKLLRALGISRVSLGFQSLTNEVVRNAGRVTDVGNAVEAFHLARNAGFTEINVDLLAGLPGETAETWRQTVERTAALQPDCVTLYQMELSHNSRFYKSIQAGRHLNLPAWPEKRAWVDEAFRMLEEARYTVASSYMAVRHPERWRFVHYVELYWHGADLLALGESAFGYLQDFHYQNVDALESYGAMVGAGRLPLWRALQLGAEEQLRREALLQLKTGRLSLAYFRRRFGIELQEKFRPQFEELERQGLLALQGSHIMLTREGLLQVDRFLPCFYLPQHRGARYT